MFDSVRIGSILFDLVRVLVERGRTWTDGFGSVWVVAEGVIGIAFALGSRFGAIVQEHQFYGTQVEVEETTEFGAVRAGG